MHLKASAITAIFAFGVWTAETKAETYVIGPGDVLELRVLEWQPVENRVLEWESMRAELPVNSDGMVSIPFLGQVEAQLLSPAELSASITAMLQGRFAVSASLDAAIQVLSYRPVYIAGAVRTPGEYPFRPGLTAAQLIAQAARPSDQLDTREILEREGKIVLLELESEHLTIRREMLLAAIQDRETLTLPAPSDKGAWPRNVVDSENDVLRLRQQRRARELEALDARIKLLQSEIEALNANATALERIVVSSRRDYENVRSLAEGGLAIGARVAETERTLMLTESQLLDVSTAVLQVRQGIALATAEKESLRDRDWLEDTRELLAVESALEHALTALATQRQISAVDSGLLFANGNLDAQTDGKAVVTIIRQGRDETRRLTGLETVLAPGDVVQVNAPAARSGRLRALDGTASQ
jgi:polysaccharide biosynthesis/export protein ExoF